MRTAGINPAIFRAYDIRGIYPDELDERAAYLIARAFACHVRVMRRLAPRSSDVRRSEVGEEKQNRIRILISSDARSSSPSLKEAFVRGLLEEEVYVIDAGLTTTPMHMFIVHRIGADGGAMITASHNPAKFNGIKLTGPQGAIGEGTGMEEVAQMAQRGIFEEGLKKGSVREENFLSAYISFFADYFFELRKPRAFGEKPLRIALDSGDGMTDILLKPLFEQFPSIDPVIIHEGVDMSFPHHEANPIKPETLRDLQEVVMKNQCDLGAAFDGDGDRVGFVDKEGERVPPDLITALLARYFLEQAPKSIIFYDVPASRVVKEEIDRYGGTPQESRVGHAFFKKAMRDNDVLFGGESSGHYYFKNFFFSDSAFFAFFSVLDMIRKKKASLGNLIAPLRRYAKTPELNIALKEKGKAMDFLASRYADADISWLDGVKIVYPDWWMNARPSNTEDFLRINIEADTPKLLEEKKKEIWNLLKQ